MSRKPKQAARLRAWRIQLIAATWRRVVARYTGDSDQ